MAGIRALIHSMRKLMPRALEPRGVPFRPNHDGDHPRKKAIASGSATAVQRKIQIQ
jgi:hypothetical protein